MGFIADIFGGGGDSVDTLGRAEKIFGDLTLPDYEIMERELRDLVATGVYTPEEAEAMLLEKSALADYQVDPRLKEAQFRALDQLSDISDAGGLTTADRARIKEIQDAEAGIERGAREAILQRAQERGAAGSGAEIMSQLIAGQESAGRRARGGFEAAKRAEDRVLNAIMQSGQLSTSMRGQEFGEARDVAAAKDLIARFNAENVNRMRERNVEARNLAKQINLQRKFDVQDRLNELRQRKYQDALQKAAGQTGQIGQQAAIQEGRRSAGAQIGAGLLGAGIYALSDVREKEGVSPAEVDLDDFLTKLDVQKYRYKEPEKYGQGVHYGPMAQDMEKSKVGRSMVEEAPDGTKFINYGKGQGVMLGILKDLSERIEGLENAKR